jgi:hypothetical protein
MDIERFALIGHLLVVFVFVAGYIGTNVLTEIAVLPGPVRPDEVEAVVVAIDPLVHDPFLAVLYGGAFWRRRGAGSRVGARTRGGS